MGLFDWLFGKKTQSGQVPTQVGHDIELPAEKPSGPATTISNRVALLTEREEGFEPVARPDVDGVLILGHGCKIIDGKPVVKGQTIDRASADRNCRAKLQQCADAIARMVKRPLKQGELDALSDFVYNAGLGAFQSSTILRTINANGTVTEDMFTRWNKIHTPSGEVKELDGLTERRKAEYQLWRE